MSAPTITPTGVLRFALVVVLEFVEFVGKLDGPGAIELEETEDAVGALD